MPSTKQSLLQRPGERLKVTETSDGVVVDDMAKKNESADEATVAVLQAKQLLVDLDRRSNQVREGIRALHNEAQRQQREYASLQDDACIEDANGNRDFGACTFSMQLAAALGVSHEPNPHCDGIALVPKQDRPSQDMAPGTLIDSNPRTMFPMATERPPVWLLCSGGSFIQAPPGQIYAKLLKDKYDTANMIEEGRTALKARVVELAHIEGPDSALKKAEMF